jgi:hypothetical protein
MQWAETSLTAMTGKFVQVYQGGIVCQNRAHFWQAVPDVRRKPGPITGKV